MNDNYIGEIAAVTTSFLWAFGSIFFTIASRRLGSNVVNRFRLGLACILLSLSHYFFYGSFLPITAESYRWVWLGLSGIIGLSIGDIFLFKAFSLLGPQIPMLLMCIVPVISALFAWIYLQEILSITQVMAILITISGISWVILGKNVSEKNTSNKSYLLGILMGIGGALGQAFGLITAKKGLGGDFSGLSANLIRMFTATIFSWGIILFRKKDLFANNHFTDKKGWFAVLGGAVLGPFIGVWLVMISIKHTHIGIASTLQSLSPVFLIPLTFWIFKDRITWRSVIGTIVATAGVALIFLG